MICNNTSNLVFEVTVSHCDNNPVHKVHTLQLEPQQRCCIKDLFPLKEDDFVSLLVSHQGHVIAETQKFHLDAYAALLVNREQMAHVTLYPSDVVLNKLKAQLRQAELGEQPTPEQLKLVCDRLRKHYLRLVHEKAHNISGSSNMNPAQVVSTNFSVLFCYHEELILSGQMSPGQMYGAFKSINCLPEDERLSPGFFLQDELVALAVKNYFSQ